MTSRLALLPLPCLNRLVVIQFRTGKKWCHPFVLWIIYQRHTSASSLVSQHKNTERKNELKRFALVWLSWAIVPSCNKVGTVILSFFLVSITLRNSFGRSLSLVWKVEENYMFSLLHRNLHICCHMVQLVSCWGWRMRHISSIGTVPAHIVTMLTSLVHEGLLLLWRVDIAHNRTCCFPQFMCSFGFSQRFKYVIIITSAWEMALVSAFE